MSTKYFLSKKEAEEVLEKINKHFFSKPYYLNHGEYSQPEYVIRKRNKGFVLFKKHFYYANCFNAISDYALDEQDVELKWI